MRFEKDEPKSKLAKAIKRTKKAFKKHMNEIAVHSEYVAAIATRNGQRMWAGRSVVSELLVTFRLTAFTSEVGESFRPLAAA